jgi:signal transduction histidine kinase
MKRKLIVPSPAEDLAESLRLQTRLRQVTHRVLAAQEEERYQISHELQDEIAQTLLGIDVRLLALKQGAQSNARQFKKQIASAQRLVVNSAKTVRQLARKLNLPPPASGAALLPTS